jgi:hypothetical protein
MRQHPLLLDELAVGYSLNEEVARARYQSIDGSAIGQIVLCPEAAGIGPMTLEGWDHE